MHVRIAQVICLDIDDLIVCSITPDVLTKPGVTILNNGVFLDSLAALVWSGFFNV